MMKDNKMMSNNFRNTFNENQIYVRWSTGTEPLIAELTELMMSWLLFIVFL